MPHRTADTIRYGTASRETKARTGDDLAASRDWSADAPPNKHRSSPIIAEAPERERRRDDRERRQSGRQRERATHRVRGKKTEAAVLSEKNTKRPDPLSPRVYFVIASFSRERERPAAGTKEERRTGVHKRIAPHVRRGTVVSPVSASDLRRVRFSLESGESIYSPCVTSKSPAGRREKTGRRPRERRGRDEGWKAGRQAGRPRRPEPSPCRRRRRRRRRPSPLLSPPRLVSSRFVSSRLTSSLTFGSLARLSRKLEPFFRERVEACWRYQATGANRGR
ncbi:hypothetical protein ALC57_06271 [Trachymyrmex cornetzi]|uniref:Uncharacterized protein n=1 Tax=Trachymyrmex cornetzi TaxID=471704 RepID=A0A195E8A4_9HYME|nr:hypothetical protein ALC57_06271 [Trachymyrmex cornetzi]